eukprot:12086290-Alexandrium_andersonii.AAC.1
MKLREYKSIIRCFKKRIFRFAMWKGFMKWATGVEPTQSGPSAAGWFVRLSAIPHLTRQAKELLRVDKTNQLAALATEAAEAA